MHLPSGPKGRTQARPRGVTYVHTKSEWTLRGEGCEAGSTASLLLGFGLACHLHRVILYFPNHRFRGSSTNPARSSRSAIG